MTEEQPNGAIIEREGPIHISNVRLLEKKTDAKESKGKSDRSLTEKAPKVKKTTKKPTAE